MNKLIRKLHSINEKWWSDSGIDKGFVTKTSKKLEANIEKRNSFAIQSSFFNYCNFSLQAAFRCYFYNDIEQGDRLLSNAHIGVSKMLPLHIDYLLKEGEDDEDFEHIYEIFEGGLRIAPEALYFHMCLSYLLDREDDFKMYASYVDNELSRVLSMTYDTQEPDVGVFCSSLATLITKDTIAENPGWWEQSCNDNTTPFSGPYIDLLNSKGVDDTYENILKCIEYRLARATSKSYSYFSIGYCGLMPFELMCYIKYINEKQGFNIEVDHPLFKSEFLTLGARLCGREQEDSIIIKAINLVDECSRPN